MTTDYKEKLRHPKWQKKRLEILNHVGWRCQLCGTEDKQLHVHHSCYEKGKDPWAYDNKTLLCLCDKCHMITHATPDEIVISFLYWFIIRKNTNSYTFTRNIVLDLVKTAGPYTKELSRKLWEP